ncbi:uncharacterized protein EV154DRAFT_501587 [Mucor mucedo]|uniref:uncharacterized protein n=1 Tax=Mucor mucedo TaxID=29922 RepID=UPI00221F4501|nr:uncharacterized protein EV154DRAFT_501587 [Mucor mucedo]KAI7893559.1 hypothetical protein EV154DRAFT_501587 [Mucor mucedo]
MSMPNVTILMSSPQPDIWELASQVVSLIGITIMSYIFGVKTFNVQFKYLSYSRWLILFLYFFSWAFTISSTIFVSTNNGNFLSCKLSELACDTFYSGTKIIIYAWLVEKVWVVSAARQSRWKTKSYQLHIIFLTPYIAIFTLMIVYHYADIEAEGVCIIGLQPIATIPLLVFNMYMTVLFVKPLMNTSEGLRVNWKASRLHDVAKRTLVASIVSLVVSFANILTLTLLNGKERGVLCLTCCVVDVTINALTIHWVTTNKGAKTSKELDTYKGTHNQTTEDSFADEDILQEEYGFGYRQEDLKSSRPSSLQESQSSRKSLTKK